MRNDSTKPAPAAAPPMVLRPVGHVAAGEGGFALRLLPGFAPGLQGLEGFGHLQVLWWAGGCADDTARAAVLLPPPYRTAPGAMGVFATRSPARPNPIGLSVVAVAGLEISTGTVWLDWIDADDGTAVLDIKPYTPSLDRPAVPAVPGWCGHWPATREASAAFNWEEEYAQP